MKQQHAQKNHRSDERFAVALPITMEGEDAPGATHDVSAGGILFESRTEPVLGSLVSLNLTYRAGGADCQLACDGEVVRVEPHGEGYNIAVRLRQPLFG